MIDDCYSCLCKQKTAYEMSISDWSSDVCSSDLNVIANSMTGTFTFAPGDTRPAPDFDIFFRNNAGYPFYSDAIWYLTQMRRWGQIPEAKADQWYFDTADRKSVVSGTSVSVSVDLVGRRIIKKKNNNPTN